MFQAHFTRLATRKTRHRTCSIQNYNPFVIIPLVVVKRASAAESAEFLAVRLCIVTKRPCAWFKVIGFTDSFPLCYQAQNEKKQTTNTELQYNPPSSLRPRFNHVYSDEFTRPDYMVNGAHRGFAHAWRRKTTTNQQTTTFLRMLSFYLPDFMCACQRITL